MHRQALTAMRSSAGRMKSRIILGHPFLQHMMLASGLERSTVNYRKFLILGRSRTGSNFLRGLLASRGGITVLGEIFKNPEKVEWGTKGFPVRPGAERLYREDPVAFLQKDIFRPVPDSVEALGFKLFYYHAQEPGRKQIWDHLRQRKDVRVIHIMRRNILETHLSKERASRDDEWVSLRRRDRNEEPLVLSVEECRKQFEQTRHWERQFNESFGDVPLLQVFYEDLVKDNALVMNSVQEFLGLTVRPVAPQTHKQARRPINEAIANFDQLQRAFVGTEWQSFFDLE